MKKLYLLYPEGLPLEFHSLSFELITILIDIYDEEKRNFYIDACLYFKWRPYQLKCYLLKDIYEKFLYCMAEYYQNIFLNIEEYKRLLKDVVQLESRII